MAATDVWFDDIELTKEEIKKSDFEREFEGVFETASRPDRKVWFFEETINRWKMKYSKKEIGEALRPHIDLLDRAMSGPHKFTLNEPKNVTRKGSDDGDFSKIPLIGGEQLEGLGAYMGKRDGIIFVFETEGVDGTVEINGADALESLDGFERFINDTLNVDFVESLGDMIKTTEAIKREEQVKVARESYGEEFGSW